MRDVQAAAAFFLGLLLVSVVAAMVGGLLGSQMLGTCPQDTGDVRGRHGAEAGGLWLTQDSAHGTSHYPERNPDVRLDLRSEGCVVGWPAF